MEYQVGDKVIILGRIDKSDYYKGKIGIITEDRAKTDRKYYVYRYIIDFKDGEIILCNEGEFELESNKGLGYLFDEERNICLD